MKRTIEQRLARLERKCRALFAALVVITVIATCASLPPLRAQVGRYVPNWVSDRAGRVTYGDTTHYTGATADIVGLPDDAGGLSIITQAGSHDKTLIDQQGEAYLIHGFVTPDTLIDSAGNPTHFFKAMSFSTVFGKRPNPLYGENRAFLSRIGTAYIGPDDGKHRSDYYIGLMQCGGYGAVFYPQNATNGAECPGEPDAVAMTGNLYARKDLHVTGKLFVNGVEVR